LCPNPQGIVPFTPAAVANAVQEAGDFPNASPTTERLDADQSFWSNLQGSKPGFGLITTDIPFSLEASRSWGWWSGLPPHRAILRLKSYQPDRNGRVGTAPAQRTTPKLFRLSGELLLHRSAGPRPALLPLLTPGSLIERVRGLFRPSSISPQMLADTASAKGQ